MRHERLPEAKERKVNTEVNEHADKVQAAISAQREREKDRVSLRIDPRTVILVPRKNKNKEYAEAYKERMIESSKQFSYTPKKR